ncbi:hypothetical protein [Methylobacterium marchantiae]|uniref:Uncharacterized protein n=1 Tax=Methylobacterium marchantiae TaxID=600331 RepID=A0ABW3WW67_9HYPH|nr:hypothetical protein AIGOOFII_3420 [Methylobacterium marchantiae]
MPALDRTKMISLPLVALALAAPAWARPVTAKPVWATGTFVYADLCTEAGSGERAGRRITLKRSPSGDVLVYETASRSSQAENLTLDDETKALSFLVGGEEGSFAFHGTLATDALIGTVEDETGAYPLRLRRILRSHAHEACPAEITGSIGMRR